MKSLEINFLVLEIIVIVSIGFHIFLYQRLEDKLWEIKQEIKRIHTEHLSVLVENYLNQKIAQMRKDKEKTNIESK